MRFSDLKIGDKFTIQNKKYTFEKTVHKKPSCCTPEYNAFYQNTMNNKKFVMIKDDQEVDKYSENPKLNGDEMKKDDTKEMIEAMIEAENLAQEEKKLNDVIAPQPNLAEELKKEYVPVTLEKQFDVSEEFKEPKVLKLSQIEASPSAVFVNNGKRYTFSETGRSGGGMVAVVNLENNEECKLSALTVCEIESL